MDLFNYKRRLTTDLRIGNLSLGGNFPVRVQTMANTSTNDIEGSVAQCIRAVEAGSELMRYTTQGLREVESLHRIHEDLRAKGYDIPLVADVHFNAEVALAAARTVEKVRINPGNFIASIKRKGDTSDYTEEEFQAEHALLRKRFIEFLDICKAHGTAIRIGVNHGSLSPRMVNRYGDTAQGMVESCMELLRICHEEHFDKVVISMKTSNTVFMVHAVRRLVDAMEREGFTFPLHLGVTEAGEGEDGRIKSAAGIGALLADGIGDTIRVSLSEDPEREIPVARLLADYAQARAGHRIIRAAAHMAYNPYECERRETTAVGNIGGQHVPVVIAPTDDPTAQADYYLHGNAICDLSGNRYPVYTRLDADNLKETVQPAFLRLSYPELSPELLSVLYRNPHIVVLLDTDHRNSVGEQRAFFHTLLNAGCKNPVIICRQYREANLQSLQVKAACDLGVLFIDGFGDGILIENDSNDIPIRDITSLAYGILQATRVRTTKTEYISCPGCGRTLFDLQRAVARVKEKTAHLAGLKIAIMGCIVNGPGEMADADYGYVGAGRGKVSLYKKKTCIERNIPEEEAVDRLIALIEREEGK